MMKEIVHEDFNMFFFSEGYRFKGDKDGFPSSFIIKNILTTTSSGLLYFNVCGIFIDDKSAYVIFPKGYILDESNEDVLIKHANLLLQVFRKYNLQENTSILSESINSKHVEEAGAVFSLLDLLEDYLSHGPLVRETVIREQGYNGRIDWKKTLSATVPLISGNSIHYLPPIIKRKVYEKESIIQMIHLKCIAEAFYKFGWIFDLESSETFFDTPFLNISIEEIVRILHAELRTTFFDRDIHVIKLMIKYFEETASAKNENKSPVFMYSFYFHTVFEAMCMNFFNGIPASEFNIPKPEWHMSNDSIKTTSQIPDVLFVENEEIFVVDAKYYDHRYTLPGWGDLVKQHFYGFAFKNSYSKINNIFLLPGFHLNTFEYIGFSKVPEIEVFEDSKIYAFTVDCIKLMSYYITNNTKGTRTELKKQLLIN